MKRKRIFGTITLIILMMLFVHSVSALNVHAGEGAKTKRNAGASSASKSQHVEYAGRYYTAYAFSDLGQTVRLSAVQKRFGEAVMKAVRTGKEDVVSIGVWKLSYKEADEVEEAINSSWFPGTGFVTLHRGDGTLHDDEGPEEYFVDVRETRKELAKSEKYIRLCRKHIKVKTTSKMSDREKVAAITEALCHYMQYKESGRSLQYRIRKGRGVCADYSTFFKALCWANGLECRMIGGKANTGSGIWEDHAWNRVRIIGKWYYIDTTWIDSTAGAGDKITSNPYYLSRKLWRDHLTR